MDERAISRHQGKLQGFSDNYPPPEDARTAVIIRWDHDVAKTRKGQISLFALANSLARMEGLVSGIYLDGPNEDALMQRVSPWKEKTLFSSIVSMIGEIGLVPIINAYPAAAISVSALTENSCDSDYYIQSERWLAGVTRDFSKFTGDGDLPFSAYAAAFMAAGEIFLDIAMGITRDRSDSSFYSCWSGKASKYRSDFDNPPEIFLDKKIRMELGGVGAVGMAYAACVWSIPLPNVEIFAIDGDPEGLDDTNLNRYLLSTRKVVGGEKATILKDALEDEKFAVHAIQADIGSTLPDEVESLYGVCALDSNIARIAYMKRYLPKMIRGSTFELRAEVVKTGLPGEGACLACGLIPEEVFTEADSIIKFKKASPEEKKKWCDDVGISVEEAEEIVSSTECSVIKTGLLEAANSDDGHGHEWAVVFVSGMCGTIMAAMAYRELLGRPHEGNRFVFQFYNSAARSNSGSTWLRDSACNVCSPDSLEHQVWARRHAHYEVN